MRTTARILIILAFASLFYDTGSAYSPFAPLRQTIPDIAVTNVWQEGNLEFVDINVCNFGGPMSDSDILILALRKIAGGEVLLTAPSVFLNTNDCHEYRVASFSELGITSPGSYSIPAIAFIKDGRPEINKRNNRMTKTVHLTMPSYAQPSINPSYTSPLCTAANNYCNNTYNSSYNNYNTNYNSACDSYGNCNSCNYNNNYCRNANSTICGVNNTYCSNNSNNNNTNSCNYANNYCNNSYNNNNNITYYSYDTSRNNPNYNNTTYNNTTNCNYNAVYCNNSTARITYPNGGETFSNTYSTDQFSFRAEIGVNPQNVDHVNIDFYRRSGSHGNYDEVYRTDRSSPTYNSFWGSFTVDRTFAVSGWADGDYTAKITVYDRSNNVIAQDATDNVFHIGSSAYNRPDLTVDRVWSDDNSHIVIARICNIWGDMRNSDLWTTEIRNASNNTAVNLNSWSNLSKGQCVELNTTYSSLGFYRSDSYNIRVTTDLNNAIIEQSEGNNSTIQYLWMRTNY